MRELCAKWLPRLITIEQKQRRDYVSIECLAMLHNNTADFLRPFTTMDDTWVHHFLPEMKEQEQKMENRIQRRRRHFHLLARSWHQFFGMRVG